LLAATLYQGNHNRRALQYRIKRGKCTPCAGAAGMLLHIK